MLNINVNTALEIHKTKIRKKREELFKDLDVQFMKALEQGNSELAASIGSQKQALRNATNIESGSLVTLDDVKATWDTNILGDSPYSGSL